ncbi:MAG: tripartite tricarboxylate transporter family receptor [Belnapia sp.]|nr:tripartite tricarboxylate transporter family receptor [Belnapia sp.]
MIRRPSVFAALAASLLLSAQPAAAQSFPERQQDFPAANLAEFIAAIRARPGEYPWDNEGLGGAVHPGVERILRRLDLNMTTLPFQGAGQTLPAFLGRDISFYRGSVVGAMPAVRAATARCLLLTTEEDHPDLPAASGLGSIGLVDHAVTI